MPSDSVMIAWQTCFWVAYPAIGTEREKSCLLFQADSNEFIEKGETQLLICRNVPFSSSTVLRLWQGSNSTDFAGRFSCFAGLKGSL